MYHIPLAATYQCAKMQVEVLLQFFVGYYSVEMAYYDDFYLLVRKNLLSLSGFWFDCFTSIPFSYMDLTIYMVCTQAASRTTPLHLANPLSIPCLAGLHRRQSARIFSWERPHHPHRQSAANDAHRSIPEAG